MFSGKLLIFVTLGRKVAISLPATFLCKPFAILQMPRNSPFLIVLDAASPSCAEVGMVTHSS